MSKNVVQLTDANFEQEVLQHSGPVLVDFWAAWCGPCRALGPVIDELADRNADAAKIAKLNIDDNPEITQKMGVKSIPAVLIYHQGQVVESLVGVRPIEDLQQALDRVLAAA